MLVAALSLLGPLILPGDPVAQSLMKALTGPEAAAPLGYDHPGRSVFCRLADALRLLSVIALTAVMTVGLVCGTLAARLRHACGGPGAGPTEIW
ncbi:hypothetical protein Q4543_22385 [Salipiger sp. 1_MG-2023]|uniref:hypothetical protein n=1 Tax=Salipiger sp. 1_MG-2023 TaxID=3062665 RepID=UPI0026E2FB25|nr:hypothetical protein [Salipiger sp. 1_MG-2023]MDO6588248.1 hypothetical protein [Salipiger sp. 1_MG-2023]